MLMQQAGNQRFVPQPSARGSQNTPQTNAAHVNGISHSKDEQLGGKVYLYATLFRQGVYCLLDTGSQVTVLPARLVDDKLFRETDRTLHAANGSDIPVLGMVTTQIKIHNDSFEITALVTEHVFEPMIGIDWLEAQSVVWRFGTSSICIR